MAAADSSPPPANASETRRRSRTTLVIGVVAVVGAVVAAVWFGSNRLHAPPRPAKITLTLEQTLRLESLKSQAIALLENSRIDEAEAQLREISQTLPDDEVVLRNLAIGCILRLDTDKSEEALAAAAATARRVTEVHRDSAIGYWLAAKQLEIARTVATTDEQDALRSAQVALLQSGAEQDPRAAFYPYGVYKASKDLPADDAAAIARAQTALLEALRLEPDNVFLLIEALDVLRSRQDATFGPTATRLMKLLEPLREGLMRKVRNSDPLEVLAAARSAAEEQNWKAIQRHLIAIGWIKSDDVAQSDRRRVDPHPLEFIAREFSSAVPAQLPPATAGDNDVRFRAVEVRLAGGLGGRPRDVVWGDADLDDVLDLWVVETSPTDDDGSWLGVHERGEAGEPWRLFAGVELPIRASRLLLADLDRDDKDLQKPRGGHAAGAASAGVKQADLDAVVYGPGGVRIVRCDTNAATGERSLTVLPQPDGLDTLAQVTAAALGDFDHDGDLDLGLGTAGTLQIWINRGNGLFDNVSRWSLPPESGPEFTSLVAADLDRDVDIDLVAVGLAPGRGGVFENLRHLNFRWRDGQQLGWAVEPRASFSDVQVIEADGNASWDLVLAGDAGIQLTLSDTPAAGVVTFRPTSRVAGSEFHRMLAADFDNDGQQDLLTLSESGEWVIRGMGGGKFDLARALDGISARLRTADAADFDRDGDLDVVGTTDEGLLLLHNESPVPASWLDVEVRGLDEAISGRVNFLGIGSVVEVRDASGRYQAQLVQRAVTHFGLGKADRAEVARVLFTNGVPQSMIGPEPRQVVRETQRLIGSCPYCYVWNGRQYEFATDLLWAAPLGLITAEGRIMPDRPWEYLKLDGDRLATRNGHYELLLTEELWEAGYFDEVELLAVDHPADVEIYSNEKVGPAELAKFQIHTVRQRRSPVAARDSAGRDVLPDVRQRDHRYAQCFRTTYRQGLAETHFLELDLGRLENAQRVTLFLTGWIRPTDTSSNLALSQDGRRQGPRPPRILVPSDDGQWREAVPFMGFPGGKTKTIAVDLTGVLALPDGRLRIETSAELRWDEVFFTVDDEPVECRVRPLELRTAELRYGGFSLRTESAHGGPETYDRSRCDEQPQWPPMRGFFTRYGDVRELLVQTDDRLAILGAGDELVVRFADPGPPPAGWKRDFILHNVGWDKDCVLNTVLGQTVEPLPFQEMQSYPYDTTAYPETPVLRAYLRDYQTRRQSFGQFWRQLAAPARKN